MAEINNKILELSTKPIEELKEKQDSLIQKYVNLKESNAVIQIIWKVKIENIDWFLLEKKELQL